MRIGGFVLHLERATSRRAQAERLAASAPVPTCILSATDGAALSAEDLARWIAPRPLLRPAYPFALSPGELGCLLSHREAWSRILDQGLDAAMIYEDDAALGPGHAAAFALAASWLKPGDWVQFQTRPLRGPAWTVAECGDVRILAPRHIPLRTTAQLVGRAAAQRMLTLTETIDRPIDTLLQLHWETGVRPVVVVPSGVTEVSGTLGGSTISHRRPLVEKLGRTVRRAIYRGRVWALSWLHDCHAALSPPTSGRR